jgi:hypothetical protein
VVNVCLWVCKQNVKRRRVIGLVKIVPADFSYPPLFRDGKASRNLSILIPGVIFSYVKIGEKMSLGI